MLDPASKTDGAQNKRLDMILRSDINEAGSPRRYCDIWIQSVCLFFVDNTRLTAAFSEGIFDVIGIGVLFGAAFVSYSYVSFKVDSGKKKWRVPSRYHCLMVLHQWKSEITRPFLSLWEGEWGWSRQPESYIILHQPPLHLPLDMPCPSFLHLLLFCQLNYFSLTGPAAFTLPDGFVGTTFCLVGKG